MATSKYSDIEIQTAENLLKEGYKWIARDESEGLFAYSDKPIKLDTFWCSDGISNCVCYFVPIFQNVKFEDAEPTSLESIVHPQILDDAEKRYLSGVIRPFRDNVKYIVKWEYYFSSGDFDQIFIRIKNKWNGDLENVILPEFIKGTMYKGMEFGRSYSLEELGL